MSLLPQRTPPGWIPGMPGGPGVPTQGGIDRRKQIAEALMRTSQQGNGLSGPWGAIAAALSGGIAGYQQKKAGSEQTALDDDKKRQIAEALVAQGGDPKFSSALGALPLEAQQGILGSVLTSKLAPKTGSTRAPVTVLGADGKPKYVNAEDAIGQQPYLDNSGAPIAILGPDGKPKYVNRGEAVGQTPYSPAAGSTPSEIEAFEYYSKLPPDQQAVYLQVKRNTSPFSIEEVGGAKNKFNKITGDLNPVSSLQEEAGAKQQLTQATETGKTFGQSTSQAQVALPGLQIQSQQALDAIRGLKNDPGFDRIFGLQGAFPNFPGGQAAGAQTKLDQVRGKTFLEAFESLKGAGQITEIEGAKAEQAIARLQQTQSPEDARQALDELEIIIMQGLEKAKIKTQIPSAEQFKGATKRDFSAVSDDDLLRELGQ